MRSSRKNLLMVRLCELQGMKHLKILFALPFFSDGMMMLFDGLYYVMRPNMF
jgi:hypothetical protein